MLVDAAPRRLAVVVPGRWLTVVERSPLRLSVPPKRLAQLSFCQTNLEGLDDWLAELPMANVDEAAKRLYRAIGELNQLEFGFEDRYAALEALRAPIHFTCVALARRFLNQPSLLNGAVRQLAQQCQVLQNQLAVGYKVVVVDALRAKVPLTAEAIAKPPSDVVPLAIYRAIDELSNTLLRSCQLYTDPAPRVWLELNQLELLSERTRLDALRLDAAVDDESAGPFTIREAYLRAALLVCASPNKLRQRHLSALYDALAGWVPLVEMARAPAEGAFVIDLREDEPPVFAAAFNRQVHGECRVLNTDALVAALDEAAAGKGRLKRPEGAGCELLEHAAVAFSRRKARAFTRSPMVGTLEVCIGFTSAHFHLADQVEFDSLLARGSALAKETSNPFIDRVDGIKGERGDDAWSNAFDVGGTRMAENPDIENPESILLEGRAATSAVDPARYPTHLSEMVDTSPGGYCVRWRAEPPPGLQTGEILAVRENGEQRWSLATVRWMRQVQGKGHLTGMQLLSPAAIPVGACVLQKRGDAGSFMRALLLPAMKAIRLPQTLLTPRLPFQSGQKITLNQSGVEVRAQLGEVIGQSEGFSQFAFRLLETVQDINAAADARGSMTIDFDEIAREG
jgi:hypothetical protein